MIDEVGTTFRSKTRTDRKLRSWLTVSLAACSLAFSLSFWSHSDVKKLDHYTLGQVYQQLGQTESAIEEYRAAIIEDSNNEFLYIDLGDVYLQMKRYDEAKLEYEQAEKLSPHDWRPYLGVGQICQQTEHLDEAIEDYLEVITLKPNSVLAHYYLGTAFHEKGEIEKARTEFLQAVAYDPTYRPAQAELSSISNSSPKQ